MMPITSPSLNYSTSTIQSFTLRYLKDLVSFYSPMMSGTSNHSFMITKSSMCFCIASMVSSFCCNVINCLVFFSSNCYILCWRSRNFSVIDM